MTTKKSPSKKVTPVKKASAKKPPTKRTTKTRVVKAAPAKAVALRRETEPFMTFRINRQTLYWTVFGIVVVAFTAWILRLQSDIQTLYDQIDATTASEYSDIQTAE